MSKSTILSLILVVMLSACGGKEDANTEDNSSLGDAINAVGKLDDVADASKNIEKRIEALKKLTPLTNEQLKSVLPETIAGIARSSFEINNAMGLHLAEAKFYKEAQHIDLQITDGAGEMGASMLSMVELATVMGGESESQTGYTKPIVIGTAKGTEKQDKTNVDNVTNEVTLVVADRFILTTKATGLEMDALKTTIKDSSVIEKLEALK